MPRSSKRNTTDGRREFLKTSAVVAGALAVAPFAVHAEDKAESTHPIIGSGEHQYECHHGWGEVPDSIPWHETHGVTVDREGLIYVKHRSAGKDPIDTIVVFDPTGKFVRSFGKEYHGGGHGIDLRLEGNEEFLYLSDVKNNVVVKTNLKGEQVWVKGKPEEPGVYTEGKKYCPTNVALGTDGGFYIADGYGSHFIHQYDKDAKWIRTFGGAGKEPGKMQTPHGLMVDQRAGRDPSLLVADRANARLQYFTLDGQHQSFVDDVSFPAHVDFRGDLMLIADLHARVSIFGADNKAIVHLGYDADWTKQALANGFAMRRDPKQWQAGRFVHPHDACFDKDGNIFVVEWVSTGRVTFLKKVV